MDTYNSDNILLEVESYENNLCEFVGVEKTIEAYSETLCDESLSPCESSIINNLDKTYIDIRKTNSVEEDCQKEIAQIEQK